MKRRITPDQLQELTRDQQKILRERWKPETGDKIFNLVDGDSFFICLPEESKLVIPLLDIGQMIEILHGNYPDLDLYTLTNCAGASVWKGIGKFDGYKAESDERIGFDVNELCDALWNAVKDVLARM